MASCSLVAAPAIGSSLFRGFGIGIYPLEGVQVPTSEWNGVEACTPIHIPHPKRIRKNSVCAVIRSEALRSIIPDVLIGHKTFRIFCRFKAAISLKFISCIRVVTTFELDSIPFFLQIPRFRTILRKGLILTQTAISIGNARTQWCAFTPVPHLETRLCYPARDPSYLYPTNILWDSKATP